MTFGIGAGETASMTRQGFALQHARFGQVSAFHFSLKE